jgi:hypothetical protein
MEKRLSDIKFSNPNVNAQLRKALADDIKAYSESIGKPEIYAAFTQSKQNWARVQDEFGKNPLVKRLELQSGQGSILDERVVTEMFSPNNVKDAKAIQRYMQETNPELWEQAKNRFLANFFDPRNPTIGKHVVKESKDGLSSYVHGSNLAEAVKRNEKVFEEFFDPQIKRGLEELATLGQINMKNLQLLTAEEGGFNAILRAGSAGGFALDPTLTAVLQGAAPLTARSLMHAQGVLKKWATEGYVIPQAAQQGLRIGGQAVQMNPYTRETTQELWGR